MTTDMSVREKLAAGLYDNADSAPCNHPGVIHSTKAFRDLTPEQMGSANEYLNNKEMWDRKYQEDLRHHRGKTTALENQFWQDLANENGVTGHQKEPMLRDIIRGHTKVKHEIIGWYEELSELLT